MRWKLEQLFDGQLCQEYLRQKIIKIINLDNPFFKLQSIMSAMFMETQFMYAFKPYRSPQSVH